MTVSNQDRTQAEMLVVFFVTTVKSKTSAGATTRSVGSSIMSSYSARLFKKGAEDFLKPPAVSTATD